MEHSANRDEELLLSYRMDEAGFDPDRLKEGAILLFDKPHGWSSFKLVKKVRYFCKAAKVGHAGTLDPLATGLMVICTGKCTRMIEKIQDMEKTYTGVFRFGKTTPSFDLETDFDAEYPWRHIGEDMLAEAQKRFTGTIEQTPPVYSAIRINGTRAYKFARQGREVEMKSRPVNIYDFTLNGSLPDIGFRVRCSKGTYIRTLAHDFGQMLRSGCYLDELRRTDIGMFSVGDAFEIGKFQELCGF